MDWCWRERFLRFVVEGALMLPTDRLVIADAAAGAKHSPNGAGAFAA
jgi:hypothetical protein